MATTTLTDSNVNCNHGVWNSATLTCDCDAGWSTDWLNQDVLGGNYDYCNSQASTQPPSNSTDGTTFFLADKSILVIIVALAVALAALCGIVAFCCYRKRRRRAKEEAKGAEILAAAANEKARRQEELQLQQMQMQAQEEAALQQQLLAAQLEAQRQNQALLNHLVNMSTMSAAPNSQFSASSRHHRRHWHEMLPRHQGEVNYACDANYEAGNSFSETFDGWGSPESFVQCPSSYRRGAPLLTTDGYDNYFEVLPSYYPATRTEAPQREAQSPPPYVQLSFLHPPF